jgi:predicted nucleic acid-binding protein
LLVDTSTIIEIFRHPKTSGRFRRIKERIETEELYVLVVQLAELSDWCLENKVSPRERVDAVKKLANIVPLDEEVCLEGSKIKSERRRGGYKDFSLLDGLVLAAARSLGDRLLTFDTDFSGEKDCIVLG